LGTSLVGYELEKVRIDMDSVYRSKLLRIRFSLNRVSFLPPAVRYTIFYEIETSSTGLYNTGLGAQSISDKQSTGEHIAISTIVGISSHIKARILKMYSRSAKGGEKGDSNRNPWIAKMAMQWPNEKGQMINQ
jgi:hypothetical protein